MTPIRRLARTYPGRRAFVTGAGNGMGAALARRLTHDGWSVGFLDRDRDSLERSAAGLPKGRVHIAVVDVRDDVAFGRAVDDFATEGLDLMVNAAGIGAGGGIEELGADIWRDVIDVNFLGVVRGTRLALRHMRTRDRGLIWNIASAAAFHGLPRAGPYNASKAAVLAFSETLATELAMERSQVRVSVKLSTFYKSSLGRWTLGNPADRSRAERLMCRSGLSADDVLDQALPGLASGDFYIVTPVFARILWRWKRFAPGLYLRALPWLSRWLITTLDREALDP